MDEQKELVNEKNESEVVKEDADKNEILLSKLLSIILEFVQNPNENTMKAFDDIKKKCQIKTYLPLYKKKMLMCSIIYPILEEDNYINCTISLSMYKIIYGLLGYINNLNIDIAISSIFDVAYDAFYESGFIEFLLQYCNSDYALLCKMIDDALNFHNIMEMTSIADSISVENLQKFTQTIKDMKKELTPDMIKDLKSLSNSSDPKWKEFKETVGDAVMDKVLNHSEQKVINRLSKDDK